MCVGGGKALYAWARACLRSRSNMDATTLFSVLRVSRAAGDSLSSSVTRTRVPLLTVFPANLQGEKHGLKGRVHSKVFYRKLGM